MLLQSVLIREQLHCLTTSHGAIRNDPQLLANSSLQLTVAAKQRGHLALHSCQAKIR
jgi:hypothetical protein